MFHNQRKMQQCLCLTRPLKQLYLYPMLEISVDIVPSLHFEALPTWLLPMCHLEQAPDVQCNQPRASILNGADTSPVPIMSNITGLNHKDKDLAHSANNDHIVKAPKIKSIAEEAQENVFRHDSDEEKMREIRRRYIDKHGICVVAKRVHYANDEERRFIFRLSFSESEGAMLRDMPKLGRLTYKISKIMKHAAFCEKIRDGDEEIDVDEHITSYMLKNVVFELYGKDQYSIEANGDDLRHAIKETVKVYKILLQNLEDRFLPMFFVPDQNIIDQNWRKDTEKSWEKHLKYAKDYCSTILRRLKKDITENEIKMLKNM